MIVLHWFYTNLLNIGQKKKKTYPLAVRFSKGHRLAFKKGQAIQTVNQTVPQGNMKGEWVSQMCPSIENDREKILHQDRTVDSYSV